MDWHHQKLSFPPLSWIRFFGAWWSAALPLWHCCTFRGHEIDKIVEGSDMHLARNEVLGWASSIWGGVKDWKRPKGYCGLMLAFLDMPKL